MDWRPMTLENLGSVNAVADRVHVNYPEDNAVFAERLALYPQGCFVLPTEAGKLGGYIVSHPWHYGKPPSLNTMLHNIPSTASTYYIHDIALLPSSRGNGTASYIVSYLIKHAKDEGFTNLSLVAVNGSVSFWRAKGFEVINDPELNEKLLTYDEQARFMVQILQ